MAKRLPVRHPVAIASALTLAAAAPSAHADESGDPKLHISTLVGFAVPSAGYLGPRGANDLSSRLGFFFEAPVGYAVHPRLDVELGLSAGVLINLQSRPATCDATCPYDGDPMIALRVAPGARAHLLSSGDLFLSAHVGLFQFDGMQFGGDAAIGYDVELSDSVDLEFAVSYWLMAAGDGDPRQPGERQFDAAAMLSVGARFGLLADSVDTDGDGVEDDQCPSEAEDRDGHLDSDGCVDPDDDGDGIPDASDGDRMAAEDADGFEDDDGRPDPDNDGDGVLDADDRCRDARGEAVENGCPIPDTDFDGVRDERDQCPEVPGEATFEGCPPPPPPAEPVAELTETQITISDAIYFSLGGSTIDTRSHDLLDQVATILREHPEIRIRIEGHTDESGTESANRRLSQQRADAVRRYLTARGIAGARLTATGVGAANPVVANATTEEERARNRRVLFAIVQP